MTTSPDVPSLIPIDFLKGNCHLLLLAGAFAPLLGHPLRNGQVSPLGLLLDHSADARFGSISQKLLSMLADGGGSGATLDTCTGFD